jgi:hypothetical protein
MYTARAPRHPSRLAFVYISAVTSTNSNYYTGLKLRSKMHFYGRVAAEEVLATLSKRTFTTPRWV